MELIYGLDDEAHIRELVEYNLKTVGYEVRMFERSSLLFDAVLQKLPDLILLDIMLPGESGIEVCKKLKDNSKTRHIPIIFLTAKSEEIDKVVGLEIGADDYISKPFGVRELSARVMALLRRSKSDQEKEVDEIITASDIILSCPQREVRKGGELLNLTYKEFELLKLLMQNKGKVLSRETLLDKVWGFDYYGETRTIDVHIRHLRKQLGGSEEDYILTLRGVGYKFKE